jgi:hypothetical protein
VTDLVLLPRIRPVLNTFPRQRAIESGRGLAHRLGPSG